ncbi:MAG TPA: nucleotidyltransferase domain-containing protein [Longimicrobium sp.]|uniref:nucleotidyltransferase domain-containing protein n=1 Tax=Longimicrobium sp. TaxID=2029185 RepID=UPI002ED89833
MRTDGMEGPETAERTLDRCLDARARAAVREVVRQVRLRVPAELVYAALFGSRARGDARADSDVDLLLVWRNLPPDREPQAGHAEAIAAEVAERSGVPVGVWSVAMEDLEEGRRTPMLVDALDDAVPVWPAEHPPPRVPFTPADAVFCAGRMLDRVDEGSAEVAGSLRRGDGAWVRRVRDDVVRLCTALLVLAGDTRPRRGDAVRAFAARSPAWVRSRGEARALAWVARSYPPGHLELDDLPPVPPPPVSANVLLGVAERLRNEVRRRLRNALRSTGFVCR